jgi:cytochrome b561
LLAARAVNGKRVAARSMPGLDVLARLVSLSIYICLLAIPPIGFLAASARGRTVPVFTDGLLRALPLQDLPHAAGVLATIHRGLAWALFGLIAVHLGLSILRRVGARSGAGRLVDAPRRVL